MGVHANADNAEDAARARRLGAEGIGLCRTEHMFLGERRVLVERVILATTDAERQRALDELLPLQRADFEAILSTMDGLPVTIRLLDPPLHEFLPALDEIAARVAGAEALGRDPGADGVLLESVRRMHEQNPMLGLRGVRLGLAVPGLYAMQVRAIAEATAARVRAGARPRPEIMVPLVAEARELAAIRAEIETVLAEVADLDPIPIGTMIETPRAALTAGAIAGSADFFSFGTNDLTQMTWGFSRDDVEGTFLPGYLREGILDRVAVRVDRPCGCRTTGAHGRCRWPRRFGPTCASGSVASTAATRPRWASSTTPAWTTSRARRCGSRWPGSRPAVPRWQAPGPTIPTAAERATSQPTAAGVRTLTKERRPR